MAGGKLTPRQKMINMMYLVLTAMLALNVSAEVLNAFKTIDKGLTKSITTVREKNTSDLNFFALAYNENPRKVAVWKEKAERVDAKSKEMYDYLQDLKAEIIKSGDNEKSPALEDIANIDVDKIDAIDNTNAVPRIMLGENNDGKAYDLRKKIEEYKNYILEVIDDKSPSARHSIEELLHLVDPPMAADGTRTSWEISNFESTPLISAIALLSKMQLDVMNCESEVLGFLQNQIDAGDFKFSNIETAVIPNSNYVIKGTEYKAEIFLAAYDPTQRPVLKIGGREYNANEKGKIEFKTLATTVGEMKLNGQVEFIGPDGKTTQPVSLVYQVAEPNVVVSPTKMNVVYRGIDNPMNISLSGVSLDKLNPDVTNGTITRTGKDFMLRPGSGRTCDISVFVDGKNMGTQSFRVKDLPTPNPVVEGISGKTASKGELGASLGMLAEMKDFDFDLRYTVVSFTMSVNIGGYEETKTANSYAFTDEQKQLLTRVKPGQRVSFTDIKAKGPDGRVVELYDLSVKIK